MALRDIPENFNLDSEEDLRFAVAQYFRELGFDLNEMSFEDQFQIRLGHNAIVVRHDQPSDGRVGGRSDLLLTRNGRPLAVVETKAPGNRLTNQDALQALSYARLLLDMAPFAIVTNGQETRVYDTFSRQLTLVPDPSASTWQTNGQQIPIDEDLKFEATRALIGVNSQTLQAFCVTQVTAALEDLKGTVNEGKKYVPEVYIARQVAQDAFGDWLANDMPCFALVSESGFGKTNLMCASAEAKLNESFVLFYPAMRLTESLAAAIRNDFIWEFHRERDIAYIVERLDAVARQASQQVIIFVDGIDEFPGNRDTFKSELIDLASRLRGRAIRLCISCKAFDWNNFVIDQNQSFNRLARSIYPARQPVHNPQGIQSPDAKQVGVWLAKFNDAELDEAFPRYSQAFSLQGELRGSTRVECQTPLMLRFMAETYHDQHADLPTTISRRDLYELYWERQLGKIEQRIAAEQILSELSMLSVESGERQTQLAQLRNHIIWNEAVNQAYRDLLRLGLLSVTRDVQNYEVASFGFERIRSYTYTVHARQWPLLSPLDLAMTICRSLENPLQIESVEFYLTTIDRGQTSLLTEIALHDLDKFNQIIISLDLKSSILENVPANDQGPAFWERLEQYATAYSELSRRYLPELCERILPYTVSEVGIWTDGSSYQLRARTANLPEPVTVISSELAWALVTSTAPAQAYADLQPAGPIHMSVDEMVEQLPHKLAWKEIRSQVAGLCVGRLLDESSAPVALQERIWRILADEPSWGVEESPDGRYWQILNFEQIDDLTRVSIEELMTRVHRLLTQYKSEIPPNVEVGHFSGYQRWCYSQTLALRRLYFWLGLLQPIRPHLEMPRYSPETLFQYDLAESTVAFQAMLPDILNTYRSLLQRNFSRLANRFVFYQSMDRPLLVEVAHTQFGGDFLKVSYVLLPNTNPFQDSPLVYATRGVNSIAEMRLTRSTLTGAWEQAAAGAYFGRAKITRQIGDLLIDEPAAIICCTTYPSRYTVLDQAYQLIGCEAKFIFGEDLLNWSQLGHGNVNLKDLDRMIQRHFLRRR